MALPKFVDLYDEEESNNQWLLSYSDVVTLLLCFFVVLVSFSSLDLVKVELLTQHFTKTKKMTLKDLQQKIQEFVDFEKLQSDIKVNLTSRGVEINFKDKLLFDLGDAKLKEIASPILTKISKLLNYQEIAQRRISIEGHTDKLPIKSKIYPSNWELSSARAASVVKFFIDQGLNSRRFEISGYADNLPLKIQTDRILGQPENRRVVVVITPESYLIKMVRKEISLSANKTPQ
ncbi:MAG: OmpA family protein [Elusimicrobiota bacterium]